jgi:hypothetical protein
MPTRRLLKRRSKATPSRRAKPTRGTRGKKRQRLTAAQKKRSAAAKKGWVKRRKKARLIESIADLRANRDLPLGWIERRASLRAVSGGKTWRQISYEYDDSARDTARLQELERLEIDLLTKVELYDYLAWLAEELEIDISDMYRMYLGYKLSEE